MIRSNNLQNLFRFTLHPLVLLILLICGLFLGTANAQSWHTFTTSNSTLAHDAVASATVDPSGKLWLGYSSYYTSGSPTEISSLDLGRWNHHYFDQDGLLNRPADFLELGNGDRWILNSRELQKWAGNSFTTYTIPNLTTSLMREMDTASNGDIWIVGAGLIHFDGTNWNQFTTSNSGIIANNTRFVDVDGTTIWIGHYYLGLQKYDGSTWTTYNASNTPLAYSGIKDVCGDGAGGVWVCNNSEVGFMSAAGTWTVHNSSSSSLPSSGIVQLDIDPSGNLWVGTTSGLYRFDGTGWTHWNSSNSGLMFNYLTKMEVAGNEVYFLMLSSNTYYLQKFDGSVFTQLSNYPSLSVELIREDPNGNAWTVTKTPYNGFDGLNKISGTTVTPYSAQNTSIHLRPGKDIQADAQGFVWVCNEYGLHKFDGTNWTNYKSNNSALQLSEPDKVESDRNGGVWLLDESAYSIEHFDGTSSQVWTSTSLPVSSNAYLYKIASDSNGDLWVASLEGLLHFDGTNWTLFSSANSGLNSDYVGSVFVDEQDEVWVGTWNFQTSNFWVQHFDGTTWTSYPPIPWLGVSSLGIEDVDFSPRTGLWAATESGVHRFNGSSWDLFNGGNTGANIDSTKIILHDSSGNMWFMGQRPGITVFGVGDSLSPVNDTTFCRGDSVQISVPGQFLNVNWSTGDTTHAIFVSTPGQYTVTVTDSLGIPTADTIFVTEDTSCVWPGDANDDNIADNVDVLAVGVASGSIGSPRTAPHNNNLWYAHPVPDWSGTFVNGINYKHADCDGNGLVDNADLNVISTNYGLTHNKFTGIAAGPNDPALYFYNLQDSVAAGDTLDIIVALGRDTLPADSVYGIAFTMHYDNELVDTNSLVVSYDSSWLGTSGTDLIHLDKDFWLDENVQIGISRNDQQNVSGHGRIATISVVVQDDVAGKDIITADLLLGFSDVVLINIAEESLPFNLDTGKVVVYQEVETGIEEAKIEDWVRFFPNPAYKKITIFDPGVITENIALLDFHGRRIQEWKSRKAREQVLNLDGFAPGLYFLEFRSGEKILRKKLVLQ